MLMGKIEATELQWFAVRVKRKQVGAIRSVPVGGEFETYRDRQGRVRKRRVAGTGTRVFVPEHILRRAGFEVFLPVKKELRRKNRFSPERHFVTYPLLVDWMFVGWPVDENRWLDLMNLDVVMGVMGTGGRPVQIPAAKVIRLMRRWGGGVLSPQCHRYMKTGCEFSAGDRARVVDGPLEGAELRVIGVDGMTVRGLMEILGGDVAVDVSADVLEASEKTT